MKGNSCGGRHCERQVALLPPGPCIQCLFIYSRSFGFREKVVIQVRTESMVRQEKGSVILSVIIIIYN